MKVKKGRVFTFMYSKKTSNTQGIERFYIYLQTDIKRLLTYLVLITVLNQRHLIL